MEEEEEEEEAEKEEAGTCIFLIDVKLTYRVCPKLENTKKVMKPSHH